MIEPKDGFNVPIFEFDTWKGIATVAGSAVTGAILALRSRSWVRRKTAEDGVAIANGEARIGILEVLQNDNARLRDEIALIASERNTAIRQLGVLEGEIKFLQAILASTQKRLSEMEVEAGKLRGTFDRGDGSG